MKIFTFFTLSLLLISLSAKAQKVDFDLKSEILNIKKLQKKSSNNEFYLLDKQETYSWNFDNSDWETAPMMRQELSYNNNGTINTLTVFVNTDYLKSWIEYMKQTFSYDENGNITEELILLTGENSEKVVYTYDANNNMLSQTDYEWQTEKWLETHKNEYEFDANGNKTLSADYIWENDDWKGEVKNEYSYNEDNTLDFEIFSNWQNSDWQKVTKRVSVYENGNEKQVFKYNWSGSNWTLSGKTENTFDENNNRTESIIYGGTTGDWYENIKEVAVFNADNKMTSRSGYIWENGAWVGIGTYEYDYDVNGYEILVLHKNWNSESNDWKSLYKEESEFDNDGNRTLYQSFEWDTDSWIGEQKSIYFYSNHNFTTSVESDFNTVSISVFPNPVIEELNIEATNEISSISVYDLQGKLVLKQSINSTKANINVSKLESGTYFIIGKSNNDAFKGKFVKK